jgi:hypothetical protein
VRWLTTNLTLFLAVQGVYVALLSLIVAAPAEIGLTLFAVAALFTIPLLPVYLAVIAVLPARWTRRRRRIMAVAASPLLLTVFIILAFAGGPGPFVFGVALPGVLAYGLLVRLRPSDIRAPSALAS